VLEGPEKVLKFCSAIWMGTLAVICTNM